MKILFTGLGSIGSRHLKLLKERSENHQFLAYRSGESKKKNDFPAVEEYDDLERALEAKPDVAFITNPTHRHVPTALECARADCDLFIEKPLSHNLCGVEELEEVVEAKDLITYLACNLRFHPVLDKIAELLKVDKIGPIHYFRSECGSYLPDWRAGRDYRKTYSADPDQGGGVLLDLIHEVDYACWLFGFPDNLQGTARKISDLEIESNDFAEMIFEYENQLSGSIQLDYFRREPKRKIEIQGEKGEIIGDFLKSHIEINTTDTEEVIEFEAGMATTYKKQLDYFLTRVKNHKKCENDIRQGRKVLELVLKLRAD